MNDETSTEADGRNSFVPDAELLPILMERIGNRDRNSQRGNPRKVPDPVAPESLRGSLLMWAGMYNFLAEERKRSLELAGFRNYHERLNGNSSTRAFVDTRWGRIEVPRTPNPGPDVEAARLAGSLPRPGATSGKGLEPVSYAWARLAAQHFNDHEMAIAWHLAHEKVPANGPAAKEAALKAIRNLNRRAGVSE